MSVVRVGQEGCLVLLVLKGAAVKARLLRRYRRTDKQKGDWLTVSRDHNVPRSKEENDNHPLDIGPHFPYSQA
jgi:hypothetical protein